MGAVQEWNGAVFELVTERYTRGELQVVSFQGSEQISKPYRFEIVLLGSSIVADTIERDLLGQTVQLRISGGRDEHRSVHGVVRRVEADGSSGGGGRQHRYRVWLVPRLWLLGQGRNSRIFQDKTVREIIDQVLAEANVERRWALTRTYTPRSYCVQYQESDLRFVQRLLAEEGIFYSFEHPEAEQGREVVLFTDGADLCAPIAGDAALEFRDSRGMEERQQDIRRFRVERRIRPGSVLVKEFDFLHPLADLSASDHVRVAEDAFDVTMLRVYEHQGDDDGVGADATIAARRLEQHRARAAVGAGEGRCPRLLPGRWFELHGSALEEHDGRYTVFRIEHEGHHPEAIQFGAEVKEVYLNRFWCVPANVACRPRRPKRRIQQVLETATVVGPAGQEIHTDEHGRIKVQFHWDRHGQRNERSSCWIRVMQPWAGAGWGFQFIPRIGMEVMVAFLMGDTDRPMVLGSVYNAQHPPPFALPANKTKSGIKTRSSRGGDGYNEISFEDRSGHERVSLHTQKDLDVTVRNDHTTRVGANQTDQVSANRFTIVNGNSVNSVGGNLTHLVACDEAWTVEGNRSSTVRGDIVEVAEGRVARRVAQDLSTRIGGRERREVEGAWDVAAQDELTVRVRGSITTVVGQHDAKRSYVLHVEGVTHLSSSGVTEIASEKEILLRCGKSTVRVAPDKIELISQAIFLKAEGGRMVLRDDEVKTYAKSRVIVVSDDKVVLKSSGASVDLSSEARIDGSKVKLKSSESASDSDEDEPVQPTKIELVDQEGNPLPYQRYRIILGDGSELTGILDQNGKAEVDLDAPASIVFPDLAEVEED
jgi:type VI secretion system secreted protein VgrG